MDKENEHCCSTWYKDFCECSKEMLKKSRKKSKERNVDSTIWFLNKHKIEFEESNIYNVVIIKIKKTKIYLSLKQHDGLFKIRFEGNKKWYTFSSKKLIEQFSKQ